MLVLDVSAPPVTEPLCLWRILGRHIGFLLMS